MRPLPTTLTRWIQYILLGILVFLVLNLLLIRESIKKPVERKDFEPNYSIGTATRSNGLSLSSACLSREVLDSNDVTLYSNRPPNKLYYLTIGIPTISRSVGNHYLMQTLHTLTANQSTGNTTPDILIVLQLGDGATEKRTHLASEIQQKYSYLIENGILDIIQVYPSYYPSFENLKQRFGDKEMRIKWRSKQVIDFSFLLCYCYGLGNYHLQVEDDVVASPYYFLKLQDFIEEYEAKEKWFVLDAAVLGYIGKVYHNHDLNEIATFFYIFFDEMPVDWLEYSWRQIKGQAGWRLRSASLFQHIGIVSSLRNKNQTAKEPYFDKQKQKYLGLNPSARLYTNLKAEHSTNIMSAYERGSGYFWGRCLDKSKCIVRMNFEKAVLLQRVVVESGANFARNDTIHHGSLETGTYLNGNECVHYERTSPTQFKNGHLEYIFSKHKKVTCLKLVIDTQREWVFIRDINIWGT